MASVQSMRDCIFRDDIEAANRRGSALIERIAESAEEGEKPTMRLSASQAADVLSFIGCAEPVDPAAWWKDQNEVSHVSGFYDVLGALEDSVRSANAKPSAAVLGDFQGDLRGVLEHLRMAERDLPANADLSTVADALERLCERFERAQANEADRDAQLA